MTMWDHGKQVNVTVIQIVDNQVVQVKTKASDGYVAMQIGARNLADFHATRDHQNLKKYHYVRVPQQFHFEKAGVPMKRKLMEFMVTDDSLLPVGTTLTCAHFMPGQYVDVRGKSKYKGFQGCVKRWGFKMQPRSHGNTKTIRAPGAMGGCQNPGRVWPGKKMPGHMGDKMSTAQSLKVLKIEPRFNLVYVCGAVPGDKDHFVRLSDAMRKKFIVPPPFPTYIPGRDPEIAPEVEQSEVPLMDDKW